MKAEMSAPAPELTGDSIGFFLIDYSSSLAMVCRYVQPTVPPTRAQTHTKPPLIPRALSCVSHNSDKYGFLSRDNEFGNHAVRAMGGIHFKPNPKGLDFLGVAEEFMVHSLGEILSGYLLTPSRCCVCALCGSSSVTVPLPPCAFLAQLAHHHGADVAAQGEPHLHAEGVEAPEEESRGVQDPHGRDGQGHVGGADL